MDKRDDRHQDADVRMRQLNIKSESCQLIRRRETHVK